MKIWVTLDQQGDVMDAFKKKPTLKSIKKFYNLDDEIGAEIAEDIFASITSVELH